MAPQRPRRTGNQDHDGPGSSRPARTSPELLPTGGQGLPSGPGSLPALQRLAGNAAVTRAVQRSRADDQAATPLQRMPRRGTVTAPRTAAEPGTQRATREDQEDQIEQIAFLPAMWVPAEEFDADGRLVAPPTVAYAREQRGYRTDALRVGNPLPPRASTRLREGSVRTSWVVEYQTSFFVYRVQLINDRHGTSATLIDPTQPFTITQMIPKGSGGRSMGRTYRFGDFWGYNPGYAGVASADLAEQRGLDDANRVDRPTPDLVALPTDRRQPFVFYTRRITDSNFTHSDGSAHESRRFMSARRFDEQARDTPDRTFRQQVRVSNPPLVDRGTGGRSPMAAMGGVAAHALMPTTGHGGTRGRLASHEWCHLVGDGDGGPNWFDNLVVGTNAVNTEQLAMETALRDYVRSFSGLGCAIRLNVQALLERTEATAEFVPDNERDGYGRYNKADWISYAIDIIEAPGRRATEDDVRDARVLYPAVHRQIMDANRGVITESEFTSLHNEVRAKLRAAHDELSPPSPDVEHSPGSPMQYEYV
ncbi:hypothetical protein [Streptacidiphilus pinicola]|nr:hypothetical protein [Streptacidiphilus pinicola]